ncbi:MAG: tRNA preQ1(34) S-adenosylmethionine ribosyltransferase-isomerase QueA [Acidimicrobiales bacterium]
MNEFDYTLPEHLIAQEPVEPRSSSRLLVAVDPSGEVAHRHVFDLPDHLGTGDVLVLNDTRVDPARLLLHKSTGGSVEVLLVEPTTSTGLTWNALVRRSRRVPPGTLLYPGPIAGRASPTASEPVVEVGEVLSDDGLRLVTLSGLDVIGRYGTLALPPYIHHRLADPDRYQTVYARHPGSVAAPTAGLHFDAELLERCRSRGATVAFLKLSVGLGTFRPVTAANPQDHVMHAENYELPQATWEACRQAKRVVAVGTTTVRALESVAATGELKGRTSLFIHGNYQFAIVDVLMTNFHMPRSSLLMMLDAFCGGRWRHLYRTAQEEGYRFLSFGDAMLVARSEAGQ